MTIDWTAIAAAIAAIFSAIAAGTNVWIAITDRRLKKRRAKLDTIKEVGRGGYAGPPDLTRMLNVIAVDFIEDKPVLRVTAKLSQAIPRWDMPELNAIMNELLHAMFKTVNIEHLLSMNLLVAEAPPKEQDKA